MEFDDTYTGPRWTYGSIHRPFTHMFPVFKGFILWSDKQSNDYPQFGTMQTTQPIPAEKAAEWGMILVEEVAQIATR